MIFTSRSAVEAYQSCGRLRYNQNFLLGQGVVRKSKSVPLVTGGAVHRGVEHLMNRLRIAQEPDVDVAVDLAIKQYVEDVGTAGFSGKQLQTDKQQWFTFCEQKALTEALVRAWGICELPRIVERFKVLAVERDIEPIEISPGVMWQAKVDAELQEKETGDYINYSLKTCSQWGEKMEESYKSDLQGVTEIWSVEEDQKRANQHIDKAIAEIQAYADQLKIAPKQLVEIAAYLSKKKVDKKISGIRFCFLVKGKWMVPPIFKDNHEAVKVTYSPLIRGYKFIGPNGIAYAHSWNYPNPDNKSGKSVLGKGWEPFNVWEDMGVKKWMELLQSGQIQPDCGDIIREQVITPGNYMRYEAEMVEGMREVVAQENAINLAIEKLQANERVQDVMDGMFQHNRKQCHFQFGAHCQYMDLCWSPEVQSDPIGSGLYEIRTPHHDSERNYHK